LSPNTKTPTQVRAGVPNHDHADLDGEGETIHSNAKPLSIASGKPPRKDKGHSFSWAAPDVHFARVRAGTYEAIAVNCQGPEKVRRYGRWSLRVGFELLCEPIELSMYFNMGRGEKPVITRHGRFFETWCLVNRDLPRLGQQMTPDIFLERGLIYTVQVVDAAISAERLQKPEEQIYSRVEKILKVAHS
jgi:hypothetical protein